MQGRRDQKQQWGQGLEFAAAEISEFEELAALVMPMDSSPIVQALKRQMIVLMGLEFDKGAAAVAV